MRLGRRMFRNTPVQRVPLVNSIYRRLSETAYGDTGTVVIAFRGIQIEVAAGDITTLPSLADGTYESDELDSFLASVRKGTVVVDIGANIGIWSVLMSKAVGPGGTVLAFEPSPNNAALLRANLERNDCMNVQVVEAAVGRTSGTGHLNTASPGATHQITAEPVDGSVDVSVVSLDGFLADRGLPEVAAIKIDVEGYEPEAIAGMAGVLETQPLFLAEFSMPQSEVAGTNWNAAISHLGAVYDGCLVFDGRTPTWVRSTELHDLTSSRKLLNLLFGVKQHANRG